MEPTGPRQPSISGPPALRRICATFFFLLFSSGCASVDSEPAPPSGKPVTSLATLGWEEYWTGIVFSGARIGFNHLRVTPARDGLYRIENRAVLAFRLLGLDKNVTLQSTDWVNPDLQLVRFSRSQEMDGSRQEMSGRVDPDAVRFTLGSAGRSQDFSIANTAPVYPTSALLLLPAIRGLTPGTDLRYRVFDGEARTLLDTQQAIGPAESRGEFDGDAHRVETRMGSNEFTTWLYPDGRPALERSLGGAVVSTLETEDAALQYIAAAALNKQEVLIDFSRVRLAEPIDSPQKLRYLRIRLAGLPEDFPTPPPGPGQSCTRDAAHLDCELWAPGVPGPPSDTTSPRPADLAASVVAPIEQPQFANMANGITEGAVSTADRVRRLLDWLDRNIASEAVDSFSALDVLAKRRAECQGHSYLYTAFARSLGIPTRIVNGLVYSELVDGLLYHTWTESHVDGQWVAIDPILGQYGADATHLRLLAGETPAELAPLLGLIGRISAEVIETRYP